MNRIYRIIRSRSTARTVVVSEITKARGKSTAESVGLGRALRSSLLASFLAGSVLASPVSPASTVTDRTGASLIGPGNVHELYAQEMTASELTGKVGINRFDRFEITSGDIANLHFKKSDADVHADALVNIVKNKIDIAGTVNAVRDSRLDGHLYFLSPEGIAVGASGVVNAGKLTMIVPTKGLFDKLYADTSGGDYSEFLENYHFYVQEGKNLDANASLDEIYSQDKDKGIVIEGAVNTRSGIVLRASSIDVKAGAKLLTDRAIDFSSVVNIGGDAAVNAGLDGLGMVLVEGDVAGDIILAAEVESKVDDFILPETFEPWQKITTREAFINVEGSIVSDGDVDLGAAATTSFSQGSKLNLLDSISFYDNFLGGLGLGVIADYAVKTNTTNVTLGSSGSIQSAGKTSIRAENDVYVKTLSNTPAKKTNEILDNALPVLAASVAWAQNTADVDIHGDIASGGDLDIEASAKTKLLIRVQGSTIPEEHIATNHLYVSVGVLAHTTSAQVNIAAKQDSTITSGAQMRIVSTSTAEQKVSSEVFAYDGVTGATTLAVANTDINAGVTIDRNLLSALSTEITAKTDVGFDEVIADNTIGTEKFPEQFKIAPLEDNGVKSLSAQATNWILRTISRGRFGAAGGAQAGAQAGAPAAGNFVDTLLTNIGNYVREGAAIAVDSSDRTAKVDIGQGVVIQAAAGDIGIEANAQVDSLRVAATGEGNLQTQDQSTEVLIAAAVGVTSVHNFASVDIGRDAQILALGEPTETQNSDIAVTAASTMDYNPVSYALGKVPGMWNSLIAKLEEAGADLSQIPDISDKLDALEQLDPASDNFADKSDEYVKRIDELHDAVTSSGTLQALIESVHDVSDAYIVLLDLWSSIVDLLNPASYVHFYTRSSITNTRHGQESSQADIGGNFSLDNFENKATVTFAQGASAQAAGDIDVQARARTRTVALSGSGGKYGTAAESGKVGVGITAIVQNIQSDALVALGVNARLEASSVKLASEVFTRDYAVAYAAGDADKFGLAGMVNIVNGDSSAVVSVHDSAAVKGPGAGGVKIAATNDAVVLGVTGGLSLGSDSTVAAIGFGLTDINFDTRAVASVSDNVTEFPEGMDLLSEGERADIEQEADAYRDSLLQSVAAEVQADIDAGYLSPADKDEEIQRRLIDARSVKLEELLLSRLAKKSEEDPAFSAELARILPGKILRETATSVLQPTYVVDGQGEVTWNDGEAMSLLPVLWDGSTVPATDEAGITASSLEVSAETTGSVNAVAIEGSYSGSHAGFDKFNGFMKRSKASSFMDWLPNAASVPLQILNKKLGAKISNAINGPAQAGGDAAGAAPAQEPVNMVNQHGDAAASVNVAASGSLALIFSDATTLSLIDQSKVNVTGDMAVSATDDLFAGTWAGSAAINWHDGAAGGGAGSKSFSFGASVALSALDRDVGSFIRASTVTGVTSLVNEAVKKGAQVAMGVGVAVSNTSGEGLQGSGSASVSSNYVTQEVLARIIDSSVATAENATLINRAYSGDVQVAGGIDFAWTSGGGKGGSFGGSVTLGQVRNTLQSGLSGSSVSQVADLEVSAVKATTVVNAAVAGAVSTQESSIAFGGAVSYVSVENDTESFIKGTTVSASGAVRVRADEDEGDNPYADYLAGKGVDVTGESYLGTEGLETVGQDKGGSRTVTVAVGFDYAKKGGAGAGLGITELDEKMLAEIDSSTLAARSLAARAGAKTTVVDVALGAAMGSEVFGGAGSLSYNGLEVTNRARVLDSAVTLAGGEASFLGVSAVNDSTIVALAGEAAFGRGTAAGVVLAINDLDSTTQALVEGGTFSTDNVGGFAATVASSNDSDIAAVALGAALSTSEGQALTGSLALNLGNSDTEAAVQVGAAGPAFSGVNALSVSATDDSTRRTGAGELSWTSEGKVNAGVAVAYSEIGGSSVESRREKLRAELSDAQVATVQGAAIEIQSRDSSSLETGAVGVGVQTSQGFINAHGSAAAGVVSKTSSASILRTSIDAEASDPSATVLVSSASASYVGSGAAAASGSFGETPITAGVALAINKIGSDTEAVVENATMKVADFQTRASSDASILGVAVGASGNMGTAAGAGSFNYNYIGSNTKARLETSEVASDGNIGVIAQSDDRISSWAGALAGSNRGGALGVSVAYNEITGDTLALANQSALLASGDADSAVKTSGAIADSYIIDSQAGDDTFVSDALVEAREASGREDTGLVIDASATHAISSDLFTAGIAYAGAAALTFSENYISGSTGASLADSDLNENAVQTVGEDAFVPAVAQTQDAHVRAADYTNIGTLVLAAAGGQYLGAGFTQNTNNTERKTSALVTGRENDRLAINAGDFEVSAVTKTGLSNLGISAAGSYMGVSGEANVLNDTIRNTTEALVEYADAGIAGEARIAARNVSFASMGNYGVSGGAYGAGVGIVYGAVDQGATALARVVHATIADHGASETSSIAISSENLAKSSAVMVAVSGEAFGGTLALTLTYFDFDAEVGSEAEDAELEASSVSVTADSEILARVDGADVAGSIFVSSGSNSVGVTVTDKVYATVSNAAIAARGSLDIAATARRDLRETVANIAGAIAGVGVNLQENWINKAVGDDDEGEDATDMRERLARMPEGNVDATERFEGVSQERRTQIRERSLITLRDGEVDPGAGVNTVVQHARLEAGSQEGDAIRITATERNWIDNTAGSGVIGVLAVVTTLTKNAIGHATAVTVSDSSIKGGAVQVQTLVGDNKKHVDGYEEAVAQGISEDDFDAGSPAVRALSAVGSVGVVDIIPAFATVSDNGTSGVNFTDSSIDAASASISAADLSTRSSTSGAGTVSVIPISILKARVIDKSALAVNLAFTEANVVKVDEYFAVTSEKATKAQSKTFGVTVGGAGYEGSLPTVHDDSTSTVRVTGQGLTVTGPSANFLAMNAPELTVYADNHGLTVAGGMHTDADVTAGSRALVDIASGNRLYVNDLAVRSQIGAKDRTLASADLESVSVPIVIDFAPDKSQTTTKTSSSVVLGEQTYLQGSGGEGLTRLEVSGESYASHYNHSFMFEVGVLNFSPTGAVRGYVTADDSVSVKALGGNVATLTMTADARTSADTRVSANGFSVVTLGVSSKAVNDLKDKVEVGLEGDWRVAGALSLRARSGEALETFTRATKISGAGVSWVESESSMKADTKVRVTQGARITAGTVQAVSQNDFSLNASDKYDKVLNGISAAFAGGGINLSDDAIVSTAAVDIGAGANILTPASQSYEAYTTSDIRHNVYGTSVEILGGATTRAYSDHDYSNLIGVGEGALLKNTGKYEEGGIFFAAHEDLKENVDASVDIWTIIGIAPNSKAQNTTSRKDQITIAGTLDSTRDISLYAGAGTNGLLSMIDSRTVSETYNHSAIPAGWGTDPNVELNSNNFVVMTSTGTGRAIRNINVVADAGVETGEMRSISYAWIKGGTDEDATQLEVKDGKATYDRHADNYVRVDADGALYAGDKSVIDITISGLKIPYGDIDNTEYDYGYTGQGAYEIAIVDEDGEHYADLEAGVSEGVMDYANFLASEWERVTGLIQVYDQSASDADKQTAYAGYLLELERLEAEMESLGLMQDALDENGQVVLDGDGNPVRVPVTNGYKICYVELPDNLIASGGSIVVKSDNFYGQGTLEAHGLPSITVANTSNAYLKLHAMTIGDTGGGIVYRDEVMPEGDEGVALVNEMNANGSYRAAFATFDPGVPEGESGGIDIENESAWDPEGVPFDFVDPETSEQQHGIYAALTTVEVAGNIQGGLTPVTIRNRSGSIVIDASTSEVPVNINGSTIELDASGDISQGYIDATVNIGYTPEAVLRDIVDDEIGHTRTHDTPDEDVKEDRSVGASTIDPLLAAANTGGRIAGGSIYLSASVININGTIQSGYGLYSVSVDEQTLADVKARSAAGTGAKVYEGRTVYKVNEGGAVALNDGTGAFRYDIQVYYDPATGRLLTEQVNTSGGKVHLAGRIMSTGSGKVFAADGAAEILIRNDTDAALDVNRITNSTIAGVIEITDTLTNTRKVYTRDAQGRTVATFISDYQAWVKADAQGKTALESSGEDGIFAPQSNVRYSWTEGKESSTRVTYRTDKTSFLSIITTDTDECEEYETSENEKGTQQLQNESLPDGAYLEIRQPTDSYTPQAYELTATNQVLDTSRSSPRNWSEWHFLNKHYYSEWTKTYGSRQIYVNSLLADKPIDIGFLGSPDGSISIESKGEVNLKGDIRNNTTLARTQVASSAGAIVQKGSGNIYSNDVTLTARAAIKDIRVVSIEQQAPVALKAQTQAGDIGVKVSGDLVVTHVAAGVSSLEAQAYGANNVNLEVLGSLSQNQTAEDAYGVKGARITITAGGSVGAIASNEPLRIQAGQEARGRDTLSASVSVTATGEIALEQTAGDMRIGTIATNGDVLVRAPQGALIDATPYTGVSDYSAINTLIDKWVAAGLIEGEAGNPHLAGLERSATEYAEGVQASFANYGALKAFFEANPEPPSKTDMDDPEAYARLVADYQARKATFEELDARFSGFETAQDYLDTDTRYGELVQARDNPTYAWTLEQMLYALRSAIVNKETGSTDQELKNANIVGRDVTLEARDIGRDDPETTEITAEMLRGENAIEYLKLLANADAADVDVVYETDASGEIVTTKVPVYVTVDMLDEHGDKIVDHYDVEGNPVYRQTAVLDEDGQPIIDHYDDGPGVIDRFIVGGKTPVGVFAEGTINARSTGQGDAGQGAIYLAARDKDLSESAQTMRVGLVEAQNGGNVKLYGKQGVVSANDILDEQANVVGRDLVVEGGAGSVGEQFESGEVKYFNVDLTGALEARADGSIFVKNARSDTMLTVASAYTAKTFQVLSPYGIGMAQVYDNQGYINALEGLNLLVDAETGLIGTPEAPVRILDRDYPLELKAGQAHVQGMSGLGDSDVMLLGQIDVASALSVVNYSHPVTLIKDYEKTVMVLDAYDNPVLDDDGRFTTQTVVKQGGVTVGAGGAISIVSSKDVLIEGPVSASEASASLASDSGLGVDADVLAQSLTLAAKGAVVLQDDGVLNAESLSVKAGEKVTVTHDAHFARLALYGWDDEVARDVLAANGTIAGDVRIVDDAPSLSASLYATIGGDFTISNADPEGDLGFAGEIKVLGDFTAGTLNGDIAVDHGGAIDVDGELRFAVYDGEILVAGGVEDVHGPSSVSAGKGIQMITSGEASRISINGALISTGGGIKLMANSGRVSTEGDITARKAIDVSAYDRISLDGNIRAGGLVSLELDASNLHENNFIYVEGNVESGYAYADQEVTGISSTILGAGSIYYKGNLRARGDVIAKVQKGHAFQAIYVQGAVRSEEGRVCALLAQEMQPGQTLIGGLIAIEDSTYGATGIGLAVAGRGAISLSETGQVVSGGDVRLFTNEGDIAVSHSLIADAAVNIQTLKGDVEIGHTLISQNGDVRLLIGEGDLVIGNSLDAMSGSAYVEIDKGNVRIGHVQNATTVHAGTDFAVKVGEGRVFIDGTTQAERDLKVDVNALAEEYVEQDSIVFEEHGRIEAAGDAVLTATNGDIHVTDQVQAGNRFVLNIREKGSVVFDKELVGDNSVEAHVDDGGIVVGENVVSSSGDITLEVAKGFITIGEALLAENGRVDVHVGQAQAANTAFSSDYDSEGGIYIGADQTSADRAITARDVALSVDAGRIFVVGQTQSSRDVAVRAGLDEYEAGKDSVVFTHDGKIAAGRDADVLVHDGDIVVTRRVEAGRDVRFYSAGKGNVSFGESVAAARNLTLGTDQGDVTVNEVVRARQGDVSISIGDGRQGAGNIYVGEENVQHYLFGAIGENPDETTDVVLAAGRDVNLSTSDGQIYVYGSTYAGTERLEGQGDLHVSTRSSAYTGQLGVAFGLYGMFYVNNNAILVAENGNLVIDEHFVVGNSISASTVGQGNVTFENVVTGGDVVSHADNGTIRGNNVAAGGTVHMTVAEEGKILFNDIHAARVILDAADLVEVHSIRVAASGDVTSAASPDLVLAGGTLRVAHVAYAPAPLVPGASTVPTLIENPVITMRVDGPSVSRPIESLHIGEIASSAVVQNLWAKSGDITQTSGTLHVSKIVVLDKVVLRTGAAELPVYGSTPRRDGSPVVLWTNAFDDTPSAMVAAWHNGAYADRRWLSLDLSADGHVKARGGVLVDFATSASLDRMSESVVNMMGAHLTEKHFASTGFVNVRPPVVPAEIPASDAVVNGEDKKKGRVTLVN